ncbi:MAG: protein kinase domain-containing protein [Pseudomonadales bacterium]
MTDNQADAANARLLLKIVEQAIDLEPVARLQWLEQHCPKHLREQAERMLVGTDEVDAEAETVAVVGSAAAPLINAPSHQANTGNALEEALAPGHVIKDRFVIDSLVGRGGMGIVYRARDLRKEETQDRDPWVALKVLGPTLRNNPLMIMALQREARKAQTLAHPNIATVYDFDRDGELVYLTMELLQGETLQEFIKRHPSGIPREDARPLIRGLCLGLAYAHNNGIVHSDFKPGNVFISEGGNTRILDFGIARAAPVAQIDEHTEQTQFDAGTLGALTPTYASPEMFDRSTPHPADDVYALAIVAYQLLTGKHPFDYQSAREAKAAKLRPSHISGAKRREWRAIAHGLALSRDARTQHAAEFLREYDGMPRVRLAARVLAFALAASLGYAGYQQASQMREDRPAVAFESLTPDTQAAFRRYLSDGARFESFGDFSAALDYYHRAYQVHPRNPEAVAAIEALFERLYTLSGKVDQAQQWRDLGSNLDTIRQTDEFLRNNSVLARLAGLVAGHR